MRDAAPRPGRARPSQALLDRQREEKARWRRALAQRPFREKVAMVLELQRRLHPVLRTRRAMRWWEHPWSIDA